MRGAVHGEELVVASGRSGACRSGRASWSRMSSASSPPTRKKANAVDAVEDADALVVDGRDPAQARSQRARAAAWAAAAR